MAKKSARDALTKYWNHEAARLLVGRKIIGARYMTRADANAQEWPCGTVVLEMDDGTIVFPMTDDEGNGPGALHVGTRSKTVLLPIYTAS